VRSARGVALAVVLLAGVGASQTAQSAPAQRARILDRTLLCAVEPTGGIRELNVYGQSGVRLQEDPSKWKELPSAHLNSGSVWKTGLAGVTAGRRDPTTQVGSGLWYDARRCKRTTARVALTTTGLGGGPANQWEERFECPSPRQILIRIRAEFAQPTDWDFVSFSKQFGASGPPLRLGQVAAATRTGTPLAYADVNESGRTRLFFRGDCVRART
jgi:hypothetical protein